MSQYLAELNANFSYQYPSLTTVGYQLYDTYNNPVGSQILLPVYQPGVEYTPGMGATTDNSGSYTYFAAVPFGFVGLSVTSNLLPYPDNISIASTVNAPNFPPVPVPPTTNPTGQTPISSSGPYITVEEFLYFKDSRSTGELANDDGIELSPTQLLNNDQLAAILLACSGEVESALLASERYSTADLSCPNGASQYYLKQIVANLAMYALYGRRDAPNPPETVLLQYDNAQKALIDLAQGTKVLSFQQVVQSGVASNVFVQPFQILQQNRLSTRIIRGNGIANDLRYPGLGYYGGRNFF